MNVGKLNASQSKGSIKKVALLMISSCSLRLLSGLELFEFLDTSISTALWTVFMCLFKFRFALNDLLHTEQFTLAWSCWCFWCWCWFKKDLGFSLHAPAMHIHRPGLAVCILFLWRNSIMRWIFHMNIIFPAIIPIQIQASRFVLWSVA